MRRPTRVELVNLIANLQELGRIEPGDKLSVTSDRFSVQRKGFFSQSVVRTFSRNSARACYQPVYRQFQLAVVDRLWNGVRQPWAEIDAAFAGLGNLRLTYVHELQEAEAKQKAVVVLEEKRLKVACLDRLIQNVTPLVRSKRNVSPELFWGAAPRGYGRSRVLHMTNLNKQRLIQTRRFGTVSMLAVSVPFDTKADYSANLLPEINRYNLFRKSDRFVEKNLRTSNGFKTDAIDRGMTLNVNGALPFETRAAGLEAALLYYLNVLHGDVSMLEELSVWCSQAALGSAISTVVFEDALFGGIGHNFLTSSGIAFSPGAGAPVTKFNLFEVRFRKSFGFDQRLHDEVAEACIHVSTVTESTNFKSSVSNYATNQADDHDYGEPGQNARCPISQINIDFDFVIRRTGPNTFSYEVINDQVTFDTSPDDPARENPRWMIQMESDVA
ncbi:MAG: hypothetical protein ACKO0V_02580 [bacterium]